jgi:hypothetical protein
MSTEEESKSVSGELMPCEYEHELKIPFGKKQYHGLKMDNAEEIGLHQPLQ